MKKQNSGKLRFPVLAIRQQNIAGRIFSLFIVMLLLPLAASAHPVSDDSITTPKGEINAGVTPDSPFHFFERAVDRMRLAFTADPEKKAEKALEIARERLMEAKKMAEKGNAKAAGAAQRGHEQMLAKVEDSARKISDDNSRTRLEIEIEIENELEEHRMEIEDVESRVKSRISLSDSGSIEAVNLLSRFKTETERVRAEVEKEKEKSIITLKLETGQSDDDVRTLVRSIEDRISGSSGRGRSGLELEDEDGLANLAEDRSRIQARVFDDFTRIKVEIDFSTTTQDRNAILAEMLSRAKSLSKEDIDMLLDLRVAEDDEEPRERLKTDAKLRDEGTEAEFELEFPVNTRDREAIVNAIFTKLNSLNISDLDMAMNVEDRRGMDDDDNELLDRRRGADDNERGEFGTAFDRRRGADKPEDDFDNNNDEDEAFDRRRGADKPEDNSVGSSGGSGSSRSGGGSTDD